MWFATVACVLFPAYFLVDVNYFIRCAFTIIYAKARKKISFLDPSTIYGKVNSKLYIYLFVETGSGKN